MNKLIRMGLQIPLFTYPGVEDRDLCGSAQSVGEEIHDLLDAGLTGHIFNPPAAHDIDSVHRAGEVLAPLLLN